MKKINWKNLISTALFLALLFCALYPLNLLMRDKQGINIANWYYEYTELEKDTVDVLFLGSSHSYYSADPLYLWEQTGIRSYSFGAPTMRLSVIKNNLEHLLKTQSPKLLLIEAYSMTYLDPKQTSAFVHYSLDPRPFSLEKIKSAYELSETSEDREELIIPMILYHSRWKELSSKDLNFVKKVLSGEKTREWKGHYIRYQHKAGALDGARSNHQIERVCDEDRKVYGEIMKICEEKGIRLLLWAAPSPVWHSSFSEAIQDYADSIGIEFLDLNRVELVEQMGIQPEHDFKDEGHLNQYGSEKVMDYLAGYITAMGIDFETPTDRELAEWAEYDEQYREKKRKSLLQQTDIPEDFMNAVTDERYILVVARNGKIGNENAETVSALKNHGLDVSEMEPHKVYLYRNGRLETALSADTKGTYELGPKTKMTYAKSTKKDEDHLDNSTTIKVKGKSISIKKNGIAIAVYDTVTDEIDTNILVNLTSVKKPIVRK